MPPKKKNISKKKVNSTKSKKVQKKNKQLSKPASKSKSSSVKSIKTKSKTKTINMSISKDITKKQVNKPKMYYYEQKISDRNGTQSQNTTEYKDGVFKKNGNEVKMTPKEFLEYLDKKNQTVSPSIMNQLFPLPTPSRNSFSSNCNCGCNCKNCKNCCNKTSSVYPMGLRFIMRGGKLSSIPTDLISYP